MSAVKYPLSENMPDRIKSATGRRYPDLTVEAVATGDAEIADFQISRETLAAQAEIAAGQGRDTLAANFQRGSELISVPDSEIFEVYELLRPGRAKDADELLSKASYLRRTYRAEKVAELIEEAARIYAERNLFRRRY
ncbi:MAG TPA: diol dehydratase small subunit [Alphaproteobacteria bacterium]|nr:diol dehydratase small subunit [Alphaproteobacteria bacterium]